LRLPHGAQEALALAAGLQGSSVSEFVVRAALDEARNVVERGRIVVSREDARFLLDLLDEPPAPNARLAQALRRDANKGS
jgi:uncharacterized protein (DUF1778 family)